AEEVFRLDGIYRQASKFIQKESNPKQVEKAEPMKKYRVQPMNDVQDQPGNVLSSQEIAEVNNYDWTSNADGARESFQNQFVLQLVREVQKKPTIDQQCSLLSIGSQANVAPNSATISEELLPGLSVSNDTSLHGLPQPSSLQASTSSHVYPGLQHHHVLCFLCSTREHTTVTCPEPPPAKIARIRDLNLCKKCLDPGHLTENCSMVLTCTKCGLGHLDYIFHKPAGWIKQSLNPGLMNVQIGPDMNPFQVRRQPPGDSPAELTDFFGGPF